MDNEQSRQVRVLVLIAAALCAVLIGYNAFYVPEASFAEPVFSADSGISSAAASKRGKKVNVNTATAAELSASLPGVGDALAQRIVAYRTEHGPFRTAKDLQNVPGIGERKYEAFSGFVTVE